MGTELSTELINTNLPPKLICLFFQENNLLRIFSTIGSQVDILLGWAPTGRPRYVKGTTPHMQFRKLQADSINSLLTFTPIRQLFQNFTFKPEASSKPLKIAFKVQRLSTEASPIQRASSAYWR
jgi:hypothetical protein